MAILITESLDKLLNDLGWVKESHHHDAMASFRHKDYTIEGNSFWIELKLTSNLKMSPAVDCEIIEHGNHGGTLFYGYLETGDDLISIMKLLYIFRDDSVVQKYLS